MRSKRTSLVGGNRDWQDSTHDGWGAVGPPCLARYLTASQKVCHEWFEGSRSAVRGSPLGPSQHQGLESTSFFGPHVSSKPGREAPKGYGTLSQSNVVTFRSGGRSAGPCESAPRGNNDKRASIARASDHATAPAAAAAVDRPAFSGARAAGA